MKMVWWWPSAALGVLMVMPHMVYGASQPSDMPIIDNIPDGISSSCTKLLTKLDQDQVFEQCTQPLIQATNAFAAQSVNTSKANALSHSMDNLCQVKNGCDRHLVRYFLSKFWDECTDELESRNKQIVQFYDYLYIFNPFRDAVCSKNKAGKYCLTEIAQSMSKNKSKAKRAASVPDDPYSDEYWDAVLPTIPRSTTFAAQHVSNSSKQSKSKTSSNSNDTVLPDLEPQQVFFFLSGNSDKDALCTECSQQVLASYIGFELASPYAPGMENSDVLKSQQNIYEHAKEVCGADFVTNINKKANVQTFTEPVSSAATVVPLTTWLGVVGVVVFWIL